jgi:hypothetical protein
MRSRPPTRPYARYAQQLYTRSQAAILLVPEREEQRQFNQQLESLSRDPDNLPAGTTTHRCSKANIHLRFITICTISVMGRRTTSLFKMMPRLLNRHHLHPRSRTQAPASLKPHPQLRHHHLRPRPHHLHTTRTRATKNTARIPTGPAFQTRPRRTQPRSRSRRMRLTRTLRRVGLRRRRQRW